MGSTNRHGRMLAVALLGPAIIALVWCAILFGGMLLVGVRLQVDQLLLGGGVFFVVWQIVMIVWLVRNWRE